MNPVLDMTASSRFFYPFKHRLSKQINGKEFVVKYTQRAKKALDERSQHLIVEMQIYFSCVVQKRVLFHEEYEHDSVTINDKLIVAVRSVESQSCDPEFYAKNHPEKRELDSSAAKKMSAKELIIDYKNNNWVGCFSIV